jgi:hypothetical protein
MPREFTAAQQRQITAWEMARRWRALPAGAIFPATVDYTVPAQALDSDSNLILAARRLGISGIDSCATGAMTRAAGVLAAGHCTALLRATYVDSSGSMVVTIGIAVLPSSTAASKASHELGMGGELASGVVPFGVPRTAAAHFRIRQRELTAITQAGPYVIMSVAGFTDGRRHVELVTDTYYAQEMDSLTAGLARAARAAVGSKPPPPRCPGTPGC